MKAKDLLKIDGRSWDRYLLDGLPAPYDVSRILQVPVALVGALADCRIWHYSSDGQYSFIPCKARLLEKGVVLPLDCSTCGEPEDLDHIFLRCSRAVYYRYGSRLDSLFSMLLFLILLNSSLGGGVEAGHERDRLLTLLWSIWYHRNLLCWQQKVVPVSHVVFFAEAYLMEWRETTGLHDRVQPQLSFTPRVLLTGSRRLQAC
ncbi:hypothetical protein PVK06_031477 [Gossypium arboreum]|uniref:Reverse transcriptase zinc-binding domain-containing protein n=1 Tax=Gossypium arboreum TaxID=29729 RepID=A0ABR0NUD2_GOSAR|nr:hypothetical protein PVK06_031477 [Gossypium arboreum]